MEILDPYVDNDVSLAFDNYNRLLIENAGWDHERGLHNETTGVSTEVPVIGNTVTITEANATYSLSVGGTSQYYTKTNSVTVGAIVEPAFRYLALWGGDFGSDTSVGQSLHEIELTLATPLNGFNHIKNGENDNVTYHETKAWTYRTANSGGRSTTYKEFDNLLDGHKGWNTSTKFLQWNDSTLRASGGVLLYMDMGSNVVANVQSGEYWTSDEESAIYSIGSMKLYGTNSNPASMTETQRIDPSSYTFICDLQRYYDISRKEMRRGNIRSRWERRWKCRMVIKKDAKK